MCRMMQCEVSIGSYSPGAEVYSGNTFIPSATSGYYNDTGYSVLDSANSNKSSAKYLRNE